MKQVYERDIKFAAAQVLANKLQSAGANVIMTWLEAFGGEARSSGY